MKRIGIWMLALLLLLSFPLSVAAEGESQARVVDRGALLTDVEEAQLLLRANSVAAAVGCAVDLVVFVDFTLDDDWYIGEDYLEDHGLSQSEDRILLIVGRDDDEYFYDLYLYGEAETLITKSEVDVILDDTNVYGNLKYYGNLYEGLAAYLTVTEAQCLNGVNRPDPFLRALPIAFVIALAIGILVCFLVKHAYSMKRRSVDYPLEQFAKLELTERDDAFTGSFVTRRVISSGSSGGGGGGGRGGGGGHAGGR